MKRVITHPNFRPVDLFVATVGAASKLTSTGEFRLDYTTSDAATNHLKINVYSIRCGSWEFHVGCT